MILSVLMVVVSLVLLTAGAEGLVRGSSSLALRAGLTPLVVGLTVVAFGTSAPELVVSLKAALDGQGDIAVGNVIGANIFNILGILGVSSLVVPLKVSGIQTSDYLTMIGFSLPLPPDPCIPGHPCPY